MRRVSRKSEFGKLLDLTVVIAPCKTELSLNIEYRYQIMRKAIFGDER